MKNLTQSAPPSQSEVVLREPVVSSIRGNGPEVRVRTGPHPCLIKNNSYESSSEPMGKPPPRQSTRAYFAQKRFEKNQKAWKRITPCLESRHYKGMCRMQKVIEEAALRWGRETMGVITFTFKDNVSWEEAQRRFNSLSPLLRERYGVTVHARWCRGGNKGSLKYDENGKAVMKKESRHLVVCERGENRGRVHYHVLFQKTGADFKTGSKWEYCRWKRKMRWTARSEDCEKEFKYWRENCPKRGFGSYVEIAPLRSLKGGAAYFSKYVGKGHFSRSESMHGKQLVRYGRAYQRLHSAQFSFVTGHSADRRWIMEQLAGQYDLYDDPEVGCTFAEKFGSKWAYYTRMHFLAVGLLDNRCASRASTKLRDSASSWLWDQLKIKANFWEAPKGSILHRLSMNGRKYTLRRDWYKLSSKERNQTPEEEKYVFKEEIGYEQIADLVWDLLHAQLARLWACEGEGKATRSQPAKLKPLSWTIMPKMQPRRPSAEYPF